MPVAEAQAGLRLARSVLCETVRSGTCGGKELGNNNSHQGVSPRGDRRIESVVPEKSESTSKKSFAPDLELDSHHNEPEPTPSHLYYRGVWALNQFRATK